MSDNSSIEWTEATWNPLVGCSMVSPGCAHCYAETMAKRIQGMAKADIAAGNNPGKKRLYLDVINDRGRWSGKINLDEDALTIPLNRKKPCTYFVNSMSDLFHEAVPFEFVDKVFAVMALSPQHTFQVLTKRPERMAEYLADFPKVRTRYLKTSDAWGGSRNGAIEQWPLPNVWLGTSVETQEWADKRIPHLLGCPAALRFLSCEPLLGPLDLHDAFYHPRTGVNDPYKKRMRVGVEWVIVGGESGGGARPCTLEAIQSIVAQCKAAGVPCFVKQLGATCTASYYNHEVRDWHESRGLDWPEAIGWSYRDGQPPIGSRVELTMKSPKGGDMSEWPESVRVRQMPNTRPAVAVPTNLLSVGAAKSDGRRVGGIGGRDDGAKGGAE